jgi:predicted RNA-binding Zn-ribbon protein involved in translation (DUF1610 family)
LIWYHKYEYEGIREMKVCALCKKEIELDKFFSRKSECPECGGDLYICLNCRFYSETSHNKCLEPKAEFQRTRDKANYCDYFQYRDSETSSPSGGESTEDIKKKFDSLFK